MNVPLGFDGEFPASSVAAIYRVRSGPEMRKTRPRSKPQYAEGHDKVAQLRIRIRRSHDTCRRSRAAGVASDKPLTRLATASQPSRKMSCNRRRVGPGRGHSRCLWPLDSVRAFVLGRLVWFVRRSGGGATLALRHIAQNAGAGQGKVAVAAWPADDTSRRLGLLTCHKGMEQGD
jgi:hypothetical protein